jgi:hypothetical protein
MLENILLWSLPTANCDERVSAAWPVARKSEDPRHRIAAAARETTAAEVPVASFEG